MKASVVIVTYNRPGLALGLVKQIRSFDLNIEIIVVDQAPKDTNQETDFTTLKSKYFVLKSPNLCQARNLGINKSGGDIVIFFDDDVEITTETIPAHLSSYQNHEVLGVAGRVINDDETVPEKTDVITGAITGNNTVFIKNFWGTKEQYVSYPYGCNMSFRKSALEKVNGFDEKLLPPLCSFEEIDIATRVVNSGGKIIFSPQALVYHHRAVSGGARMTESVRHKYYYNSFGRYLAKNLHNSLFISSVFRGSLRIIKENPLLLPSFFTGILSVLKSEK